MSLTTSSTTTPPKSALTSARFFESVSPDTNPEQTKTILVVAPSPDENKVVQAFLRQAGYRVLTAPDEREGFKIASIELPDLIVSDLILPVGGGIGLCRSIRADERLRSLPIIIVGEETGSIVESLEAGADDYLEASFESPHLMAKVARLFERKRAEDLLRENERYLRSLVENVSDLISILSTDGTILYESPSITEILSFAPEEMVGKNAFDFVHPDDKELVTAFFRQAICQPVSAAPIEYRFKNSRGDWRIMESTGKVARNPFDGTVAVINSRDVTERHEAEAILRFQKTLLESQSEASIDGILVIGTAGEIIFHNQRFLELWGISEEVAALKSDKKAIEAILDKVADPDEFLETIDYLYRNRLLKDQVEIRLKDGRFFERYSAPVLDEDVYYGRIWYFRDITKRKRAEEAVKQSETRLASAQRVAHLGSWEWDFKSKQVSWSDEHYRIFGLSKSEIDIDLKSYVSRIHPDDRRAIKVLIREGLTKNESYDAEYRIIRADGQERILHSIGELISDEFGRAIKVIGTSQDITERKEAEAVLAEANERAIREYDRLLQRLGTFAETIGTARDLDAIFTAILNFATASVPCSGLLITLCNRERTSREFVYMWYNGEQTEIKNLEPVPIGRGIVGQAIRSGEVIVANDYLESIKISKSVVAIGFEEDPRQPRSALIAPMKIKGETIGTIEIQSYELGAFRNEDATAMRMAANLAANAIENVRLLKQERQSEEQLRHSQKLESVGRLAGGIAHDFNNMLTAINGYSDLVLRRMEADNPLRGSIEEIKKAGARSAALTHQLLAFSRRQVLQPKVLDLNEIVNDTIQMLNRLIGENITLETVLDPNLGQVAADPGQLTQVIMNLAVNARDAMPSGGHLVIKTANVYLDDDFAARYAPTQPGAYVLLSVRDDGIGIDDETLQHIFEPFFTTKEVGKGTGLGLPTVYGIVKQSGGYIWLDSAPGKGAAFNVYLPRIDETIAAEEEAESLCAASGAETVLIVEDEDMVRALTREILEDCGYRVLDARHGFEALDVCRDLDCKIDLVITDVVMPQMGGHELARRLSELYPRVPVLFASGYTDDDAVRRELIDTEAHFIQKPFAFDALASKVRTLLDQEKSPEMARTFKSV